MSRRIKSAGIFERALALLCPGRVVDQLAKNMVEIKNSGQMVTAPVCSPTAGYTILSDLSEKMTPQQAGR